MDPAGGVIDCTLRVVVEEEEEEGEEVVLEDELVVDVRSGIIVVLGATVENDELVGGCSTSVVLGTGGGADAGKLLSTTGNSVVWMGAGAGGGVGAGAGGGAGADVGTSVGCASVETGESTIVEEGTALVGVMPRRLPARLSIDEKNPLACSTCSSRFAATPNAIARRIQMR